MSSTFSNNIMILVPTLQTGGQERVAANTANILKQQHNVTVVIFDQRDASYDLDCKIISLNIPAAGGKMNKIRNALRRAKALKRLKKELGTDVTISFGSTANLANVLSSGQGKTIVRISSYGEVLGNLLYRFIYGRSDRIICSTRAMESRLEELYPNCRKKTCVIFNPIDIQNLLEKGSTPVEDYAFSPHTIIRHGRLVEGKNFPRLIKAFSLVRQEISDAQLLFIGDGPIRKNLEALVAQCALEESVTFLETRENPFAYLEKSSLFVLSSYIEGFPNALVEGMLFLPVVSTDCLSGPREILSERAYNTRTSGIEFAEYGVLVENTAEERCDPNISDADRLLAEGILSILTDPEKLCLMKEKARVRAQTYSFEAYREALVKVIDS